MGNFCKYCKDQDGSIYKEIRIIDTLEKNDGEFAFLESAGSGCTHFKFDKLLNISLDKKNKKFFIN